MDATMTIQKSVIIVEDEPDTADMFGEMLHLSGYKVQKSFGSRPAMHLIAQEKPDLVILDIMMPDCSGLEVLHFMRRDPNLMNIPVVVVSAKYLPDDIKAGKEAGASVYLGKPVSYKDLVKVIEDTFMKQQGA
jgi:two-component system sensor histidine kinase ChiS